MELSASPTVRASSADGVVKTNLKETIRGINAIKLSTLAACGDVCRNVMACPAPIKNKSAFAESNT